MKRHLLDEAIRLLLSTVTGKEVGLSEMPQAVPTLPYAILYPLFSGPASGSFGDPQEMRDFRYQVTCVGKDPKQAGWMSSVVEEAMTAYGGTGHLHPLVATGFYIMFRHSEGLGGIMSTGKDLYQSTDTYVVRAGES